jgi:hypothetical protein
VNTKFSAHKILLILFLAFILSAQENINQSKSLEKDIADGYLNEYSKIEAAFILSGITHPDSLPKYLDWYENLLRTVKSFSMDYSDPVGSAHTVFMYLHSTWLKTYALESTTLADIVRNKEYNCVAATILYNILCEDLGWKCEAFETPTHVYTIFSNFREKLLVENTSSMGFDIMKNLKAYSQYLVQFYPEKEVLRIGLDRLYFHENSKGRVISNTELLGLLAYNRAYLAKKNNNYKNAYDYVLLAQMFNPDSRSNVNFEINLYYNWGHQLFSAKEFSGAFGVFADGYYRYPDNEDFFNNTFASFYNAMHNNWLLKEWPESARLIDEMADLNILQEKDHTNLKMLLKNWLNYFTVEKNEQALQEVIRYIRLFGL